MSCRFVTRTIVATLVAIALLLSAVTPVARAFPTDWRPAKTSTSPSSFSDELPVMVAGPWRLAFVAAARVNDRADLGLTARQDTDWLVIAIDAGNWSAGEATLSSASATAAARVDGVTIAADPKRSAIAARALGAEPRASDADIPVSPGGIKRIIFVFAVSPNSTDLIMTVSEQRIAVDDIPAWPSTLPATSSLPGFPAAGAETSTSDLAGVQLPNPGECFGEQAAISAARASRPDAIVEASTSGSGDLIWVPGADGGLALINQQLLATGSGALTPGFSGPYAAWMTETAREAVDAGAGLWAVCDGLHGDVLPKREQLGLVPLRGEEAQRPYAIWDSWSPVLVGKPDGSAWVFFSAEPSAGDDVGARRVYASRFDPATGLWSEATAMPGGTVQLGVTAAVGPDGRVHIAYADRESGAAVDTSRVMYVAQTDVGGWSEPVPIAPAAVAGFQLAPSIAVDRAGMVHVAWQDQRDFTPDDRSLNTAYADVFVSDRAADGTWSAPISVSGHAAERVASRPSLAADSDRLVLAWSTYTVAGGFDHASAIEWSSRDSAGTSWSAPTQLALGMGDGLGGALLDLATDPSGGIVLVYGRSAADTYLFMRRLEPEAGDWSNDLLLAFGDRGTYPSLAVSGDGVVYVAYTIGNGGSSDIGLIEVQPGADAPSGERVLTADQPNAQVRPAVGLDFAGRLFVAMFSGPPAGASTQVRVIAYATTQPSPE